MPLSLSLAISKAKPCTRRGANGYNVFVTTPHGSSTGAFGRGVW